MEIEKVLTREKFDRVVKNSLCKEIREATKEELNGLFESFQKLIQILNENGN
jgi:hypothetical protein